MNRSRIQFFFGGAAIAAGLLALSADAWAGDVRARLIAADGFVAQPSSGCAGEALGCYWQEPVGLLEIEHVKVDFRREITAALVGSASPSPASPLVVHLRGGSLLPETIVLRTGQALRIENGDETAHELYAEDLASFDAVRTAPRASRGIAAIDRAGNWAIRDRMVPHVRGHLHVLPDVAAVAQPDAQGNIAFEAVPAGRYTLKVFHHGREVSSQEIDVADAPLQLDPITLTPATR